LSDRAGGEVARFTVNRAAADGGADTVLHYAARSGEPCMRTAKQTSAPRSPGPIRRPTSLSKDGGRPRRPGSSGGTA
jgi:hypothetical protein